MKKLYFLLATLLFLAILSSCKNTDPDPQPDTAKLSFKLDGSLIEYAITVSFVTKSGTGIGSNKILGIGASHNPPADRFGIGITQIGSDNSIDCLPDTLYLQGSLEFVSLLNYSPDLNDTWTSTACTLQVISCDEAKRLISGTFSGTLTDGTSDHTVTEGEFENLPFQ